MEGENRSGLLQRGNAGTRLYASVYDYETRRFHDVVGDSFNLFCSHPGTIVCLRCGGKNPLSMTNPTCTAAPVYPKGCRDGRVFIHSGTAPSQYVRCRSPVMMLPLHAATYLITGFLAPKARSKLGKGIKKRKKGFGQTSNEQKPGRTEKN